MSNPNDFTKYDDALTSILMNEKSILGFLSTIFNFLGRRTDFYHIPEGPYENMGFPPGVAEELVIKVLRTCDPKNWMEPNGAQKPADVNNEIMCSTVAQEIEVLTDNDGEELSDHAQTPITDTNAASIILSNPVESKQIVDEKPPVILTQKNSETYNGAEREKYSWSQTIMDLDVIVNLPPDIKSSKDLKVTINPADLSVAHRTGDVIIKDSLPYKIKAIDSFWSIAEGKLLLHIEKSQERWWNKFLNEEEPIDLSKIDCSRPLDELPEDHIVKIKELQWNQEQKLKGLPTSDDIRNMEVLKKAWNAAGSPFKGQEFDPSVLNQSSQVFTSFGK